MRPSPTQVKKRQPIKVPKFAKIKKSKRDERKKKRKKALSSPSSSSSSWGESSHSSLSSSKEEDYYSSPKRKHGKGKGKREYDAKRRSRRYRKFKEGGKSITFLTYNGKF